MGFGFRLCPFNNDRTLSKMGQLYLLLMQILYSEGRAKCVRAEKKTNRISSLKEILYMRTYFYQYAPLSPVRKLYEGL